MLKVELNTREPKYEMIEYKDLKNGDVFQSKDTSYIFSVSQEYLKVSKGRVLLKDFEFIKDLESVMEEEVYLLKGELKLERVVFKVG